ncbi:MAG: hypothetical protein JNJ49_01920 [Bdellovibrionaceae bacterium]|nr:hypothetical protein [Pseudobdellovibrionaceae bacterium]
MRTIQKTSIAAALIVIAIGYQNCSEFKVDTSLGANMSSLGSTGSAGAVLEPVTDKIDSNCELNPAYDACIIKQSPSAQLGAALSTTAATRRSQLGNAAIYGVKLTSLSGNGKLENSTLSVQSLKATITALTSASLKAQPMTAGSSNFEQVNTYYWMNRAAEYLDARTEGALPAKGKGIKVIVDDTITGYEAGTNTIRLKMTDSAGAVAWNGDLAIHLFGVANAYLANPTGWNTLSASTHQTCNAVDKGCCTAATGCAGAIRFGIGEYFASCLFPNRTKIGDGFNNATTSAQALPGISRDIASAATKTASTLFTAAQGDVRSMGVLYASIWWEIRRQAGTQSADIDRIFMEHLSLLNGNDSFATAISKAKTVDSRLFSGRYSSAFDSELSKRGL